MHRTLQFFALPLVIATISCTSQALTNDFSEERKLFQKANSLLTKNKLREFKKVKDKLGDYPLVPYLDYAQYIQQRASLKHSQVNEFITENKDTPLANHLNRTWLNHLAKKQRWSEYLTHYAKHPVLSTRFICQQQLALLDGTPEQKKEALKKAKELWLVGNSQPKACDPLFKAWMKTGHPTSAEAHQRFWLALDQGNTKLARYIDKKVSAKQHKQQTSLFWQIYNKPEKVATSTFKKIKEEHQPTTAILSYKRWYRLQPITATQTWVKKRDNVLPKEQQQSVTEYMGLRLNRNYHSKAIQLSHKLDPTFNYPALTESRIRNALAKQDWELVHTAIEHLPEEEKKKAQWQYWSAVSEKHLTPNKDNEEKFHEVATDRSFYGFLSAELSDKPFKLNAKSSASSQEQLDALLEKPAVLRARELFKLGMLTEANREWNLAQSQMDNEEKLTAGYLARSWGWHLQAIINAAKTKRWDHIDLRFPHPHAELFSQHAEKNDLDLSFPVAIARQESAFLFNARSRVGASGLMQLMPKTAMETAKKHKVKYRRRSQLLDPETNITLGSAYLGDMLKKFNNNPAYAAAAYNAGPHRVKKWLKDRGDLPLDVWIETIPFKETRNYVQNVLAFRVIYDRLEGRQANLLTEKQMQLLALNQNNKASL